MPQAPQTQRPRTEVDSADETTETFVPRGNGATIETGHGIISLPSDGNKSDDLEHLQNFFKGRYIIKSRLGKGNMAVVYLAHEVSLERDVAIKVLPVSFLREQHFVTRFKREAILAAKLEHPSIVRIFHIGEVKEMCYIVMSYIPGGTITQHLARHEKLSVDTTQLWGLDITSALAYAHENDIIHRDLKPDNIMIDKNTRAVLMDFGIARVTHDPQMTLSGHIIGTPRYMSPEQAVGNEVGAWSDIYAVGLILYEMLTNSFPFEAEGIESYLYHHVNTKPRHPEAYNSDIPKWLSALILKCLAKKPNERFGSILEMRNELVAHKSGNLPFKKPSAPLPDDAPSHKEAPVFVKQRQTVTWMPMQKYDLDPKMYTHIQKVIESLPDLPVNANRLIRMLSDNEVTAKEISKIVSVDPIIAVQILNVVNSTYYGLNKKTSNLHFAIVHLGLSEVRRIILKHFLSNFVSKVWSHKGYTTKDLWYHSYAVSACAEFFAKRYAPKQVGNLVTYSLLHDIGKFSLLQIAILMKKKGIRIKPSKHMPGAPPIQTEEDLFKVNHAIIGSMVAQKWGLPEKTCDIIEHHHNPSYMDFSSIPEDVVRDAVMVNIADSVVHHIMESTYDIPLPEPEFFSLVKMNYPLEENITEDVRQTVTNAIEYIKSVN